MMSVIRTKMSERGQMQCKHALTMLGMRGMMYLQVRDLGEEPP
jgi:hypothetical protein